MPSTEKSPAIKPVRSWYGWLMSGFKPPYVERDMRFLDFPSSLSAFERRMTSASYDVEELRRSLSVRLQIAERAALREQILLGRFYNFLSGENPHSTRMIGREVGDVLAVLGVDATALIEPDGRYDLGIEVIKDVMSLLVE